MSRSYRHAKEYEKEILVLCEKGLSQKEIAEKLVMNMIQTMHSIL